MAMIFNIWNLKSFRGRSKQNSHFFSMYMNLFRFSCQGIIMRLLQGVKVDTQEKIIVSASVRYEC